MGLVPPNPGFLEALISLCKAHGTVSIFDEVMTGSRLARGGAQELYGLRPDLTCLGKVVGGGLPLAVYGGRRDVMSRIAPLGPVYQAGTLSGNPLAVAAGLATLELLDTAVYAALEQTSSALARGLNEAAQAAGVAVAVQRVGSMLTVFFQSSPVRSYDDALRSDTKRFAKWHAALLAQGVYWPPSQFEAAFVSAAHSEADIASTLEAASKAFRAAGV
jgi:glutamate-1-semialdehyde 2,1-aminomutase